MSYPIKERRKYVRYDMETKIHFYLDYELTTKVKFTVLAKHKAKPSAERFIGITRNVSVEGMRFSSNKKLKKGEELFMEVYLPQGNRPIPMIAEVRWSKEVSSIPESGFMYDAGVKIFKVKNEPVKKTIYFDKKYHEPWSIVLDSVFGGFRRSLHKAMMKGKSHSPAVLIKAVGKNKVK